MERLFATSVRICLGFFFASFVFLGTQSTTPAQSTSATPSPPATPDQFVDALNAVFGKQTTFRATHAKGIVLQGKFTPSAQAAQISKAPHFKQAVPITVRFSNTTGIPTLADNDPAASPRGMAVRFQLPDGTATDLVTHSFNGFPAKNPDDMTQLLLAAAASGPTR